MNRKFLKEIWEKACREMDNEFDKYGGIIYPAKYPKMELPYLDEAQEIVGFINEMDLRSVQKMTDPLDQEDAAWLLSRYPKDLILEVLCGMENYKGLNRKYKSAKLTCNNWCRKRQRDNKNNSGSNVNIPVT